MIIFYLNMRSIIRKITFNSKNFIYVNGCFNRIISEIIHTIIQWFYCNRTVI